MNVQVVQNFHLSAYYELSRSAFSEKIGILFSVIVQNEVMYHCSTKKSSFKLLVETQPACAL